MNLLLAKRFENQDPTGWWMSEKLDGVRAYWNGYQFLSRAGKAFVAPTWFTKDLPLRGLDGEIWGGRGSFQKTCGVVRRHIPVDYAWKGLRYMVFDMPDLELPFEQRQSRIETLLGGRDIPHVHVVHQIKCRDLKHLDDEITRIQMLGGEGIMLRKPKSLYEGKRSDTLLKVKQFFDDEALVTGYIKGKGKYKLLVGSLVAVLPNGKEFGIGTGLTDEDRANPPPIGSLVTFRYQELTKDGIPRFPVFLCERTDISLRSHKQRGLSTSN